MVERVEEAVEEWGREIRKGSARLGVLVLLARGENYGYELVRGLRASGLLKQGATEATIYPLLHSLEADGFLEAAWRTTANGVPARKYYRLTADGHRLLNALIESWNRVRSEIDQLAKEA